MTNYIIASAPKQRPIRFNFVVDIELSFFDGGIKARFSDFEEVESCTEAQ